MPLSHDLVARARAWAEADPDPETRAELHALLARMSEGDGGPAAEADLADRFAGRLEFGTAGLRGVLGAGENRMNRAVVLQTTCGLAEWLLSKVPDASERGVVIGYDGRRMSREFAEDTAGVLAAAGIVAHVFGDLVPTPLVGFAVHELHAAAGVMVTASHNPPEYNGYKVYGPSAAQIIPPADVEIAAAIGRAPKAIDVPCKARDVATQGGLRREVPVAVIRDYLTRVRALVGPPASPSERDITIVYTPMHGVGGKIALEAFAQSGFARVFPVPEQLAPDGAFPTVAFPNPEEKGAMDLALALARREKADLVIANDPDADRLAVAVPDGRGGYVQLTGNQVGVLLGHHLLTKHGPPSADKLVITTIVSSPMLGAIASRLGVAYEETLTGFKWIASRAMDLEQGKHLTFVFGYEEALGYTVSSLVRDKDGVSAAAVFAGLAGALHARGTSVLGALEDLAKEYGLFVSEQVSVTRKGHEGSAAIRALMTRLRTEAPASIGPLEVTVVRDYLAKTRLDRNTETKTALELPASDVIAFELAGGSRVIARPSGTEPKIKFYFDVREPVAAGESVATARPRADATLAALKAAFLAAYPL